MGASTNLEGVQRPSAANALAAAPAGAPGAGLRWPAGADEAREVNKWVIAATVMTGTFMSALDSSIVNVALPNMSGSLGVTTTEVTWIVTGYILANVIVMPIVGSLSARIGRKRLYMLSVALFTLASMACGAVHGFTTIVGFRIVQGIGGGMLVPISQAILRESFPPAEQGIAMGLYGMGVVLAPAVGPAIGGWLTDQYSWPWIFYINVPVGALNLLLVSRFIHDPPYLSRERGAVDWSGLALLTVGLGALQLMLEQGERNDWFGSRFITWLAIIASAGIILFVWRELTARRPIVDLSILRNSSFASATAIAGIVGLGLYGTLFLLPLFLQTVLGFSPTTAGLALMPRGLAMAVLMPISGRLYNKVGARALVGVGLLVSAYSFWELGTLTTQEGFWDVFMPQLWQGVGFSLVYVAVSTAALAQIPRPRMTAATGLFNVIRQVAGSIGVAVAATLLERGTSRYHDTLIATMGSDLTRPGGTLAMTAEMMRQFTTDSLTAVRRAIALIDFRTNVQASVLAYNHIFQLVALLFLGSLPLILLLRRAAAGETHEVVVGE